MEFVAEEPPLCVLKTTKNHPLNSERCLFCFQGKRDESTAVNTEKAKEDAKVQYDAVSWRKPFHLFRSRLSLCCLHLKCSLAPRQALYNAGEKRWGTDEDKFIEILCQRSISQLRQSTYPVFNPGQRAVAALDK